ncbi:MAG TPA: crossover junction endodeoxyribonuclease RuvC [Candidatus Binatia bacterium]|nr:crossover junction endodeoxyribonuclease RuvC [Candidatus Binatia bacterium]
MNQERVRVLGIDPGTSVTGWGVVEPAGAAFRCVASGLVELPGRLSLGERLRRIRAAVEDLCRAHSPIAVALEKAFVAHNVQSAFRLGEARGAVLIAAAEAGLPVFEYAPAYVKLTVVGYGRADKRQMVRGVALRLGAPRAEQADEADALALALCHLIGARLRAPVDALPRRRGGAIL